MNEARVCILIPCLNEEKGIESVVDDFRNHFPDGRIIVVDNGSTDATADVARRAGAQILVEKKRGKASAVLAALCHIDSDLVVMVDGDGSYPAEGAQELIDAFAKEPSDMITGIRRAGSGGPSPFRPFHQAGASIFAWALDTVFGYRPSDVFSGLRLFSRRFYKNVPINSRGFELEMELTIQAIDKGFSMAEIEVPFRDRAAGSVSKLRTLRDGFRILRLLVALFRDYRPLRFFGAISTGILVAGLMAGSLPIYQYFSTGQVGRFPLAIMAASLCTVAVLTFFSGLILESNLRHRREAYQVELRKFEMRSQ